MAPSPSSHTLLCLLAFAATSAVASPLLQPGPTPTPVAAAAAPIDNGVQLGAAVINHAVDAASPVAGGGPPTVTPVDFAGAAAWASELTVTIQNRYDGDIKTRHVNGGGVPLPYGNPGTGIIPRGGQAVFTVPRGWHGNVAVNDGYFPVDTGDESQIEGSFMNQGQGERGDINVSYVNGFSVPIVCKCNENNLWAGCSKNLWELGRCPNDNWKHSCRNDARKDGWTTPPGPFFMPCRGATGAYTFPADDLANSLNAKCSREQYTCCVGKGCAPNPAQNGFH
ncbi:hypothetical protein JDV02_001982 [Purpureocillium takamizusanense]|uniref:Thaumatin-like protein n=1 Tax=Purpureocillium takamizusanense TaxID=2060973 RepID=A0A9Q8QA76_9HYPO|nr:uncharacterized protein JDV02_001982 [Purpureocillium takamizusanense]UNI15448.1 hypothetical protein JDV02_001982 [Purpureocillium takamizusanense]